jgi:threonine/homoserine/homoserine lactone efflux protein
MWGIHDLPLFLLAGLALNITPGPDMLYVITRSVAQGRAAGVASACGIGIGCFVHIFAVAFGLAGVLRAVPIAYDAVRYAGAGYLIYLGIKTLTSKRTAAVESELAPADLGKIFRQGAITNILNPKVALFFLAFLPQFVDKKAGTVAAATILLGVIFDAGGTTVNLLVALIASYSGKRVLGRYLAAPWFKWLTGSVFLGLGLRLAVTKRSVAG